MGRRYDKGKPCSVRVMEVIASHYNELKQRLCPFEYGNYSGRSTEDIFSDTIIMLIQDEAVASLKTDIEILKMFEYRFNLVSFQVVRDNKEVSLLHEEQTTDQSIDIENFAL